MYTFELFFSTLLLRLSEHGEERLVRILDARPVALQRDVQALEEKVQEALHLVMQAQVLGGRSRRGVRRRRLSRSFFFSRSRSVRSLTYVGGNDKVTERYTCGGAFVHGVQNTVRRRWVRSAFETTLVDECEGRAGCVPVHYVNVVVRGP